ncbi:MAG: GNAT family N-acetyltransferase [Actinobacteria bacterium]|nr:GNAT family N-acetyltransferase [Actinomycetota bacterium]
MRFAGPKDAKQIHNFICQLASFEREPDAVLVTPATLAKQLSSDSPPFECLFIESDEEVLGFALFFHNYSTWRGANGIHLEDLFVSEKNRGRGLGKQLLGALARIAQERHCPRLEWQVLGWNQSAIIFYESIGAEILR